MTHRLPDASVGRFPSAWMRLLILCTGLLGINYITWRWMASLNWSAWWIAVPLVLAETYSVIDSLLFALTMWRRLRRNPPPPPPDGATVDVLVTTFNEPIPMVLQTAIAARDISYPHSTWILDDGDRHELAAVAAENGIGYVTRSASWADKPRHAKAGNLNNALFETDGEYLLILDADQVPDPAILDRTLGYFRDPRMALVQTPQYFHNVPFSDPLGSQAPLFYGPIQQGKDGWNAAYFCGSNAVLRREALMQLGIRGYVHAVEEGIRRTLYASRKILKSAASQTDSEHPAVRTALTSVQDATATARKQLRAGRELADITFDFQQQVDAAARSIVTADVTAMRADLDVITALQQDPELASSAVIFDDEALSSLAGREWSPLGALESISAMIRAVDVGRDDEAQPVLPMATISVTEDMATCMRLHAQGWKSAYHHEVLARGLAPDDVRTMMTQRLRWAQGTIQVMLKENPLVQKGLSWGQRLMYWATMWSYLAGLAALAYIAAPAIFLIFGIMPVQAYSWDFFGRLVPFLVLNQLMFIIISRGTPTWRGQQYSLALFPVWIRACTTAFRNVYFGRPLGFAVTPKTKQSSDSIPWHLVKWQLAAMALLVTASVIGIVQLYFGAISVLGVGVNLFWVLFDVVILSVVFHAVRYRGHEPEGPESPADQGVS
ncbi:MULTISPECIES: glycosyltransferase family 2 protein [Mycobacteriaceae]|uniref:Cellulose synthase n=1 Tax=Mycolicibacterium neoaurum VKM Ac-1815D TaxID=700508 RepID=V5XAN1_MYCNE|nr:MULTISPECIES: glycosyltransferase family 2 protein [Mycobacteriaceae]AHC25037.1 cellulose synthase [Mycolicibacterium neoaurum VKM Ac-1815D]AMO05561.1 cellulose synthase [Mycolicibacterium neoaurum]AXK76120.1 glycosyltransferase [Mycolicibacterium neoaurum]KJQ50598.1 cellulose synthase [Mycolicibacterium neoaurum]KUM09777.1 cellulose synthase [Mycolicibacterium neoaurum]